MTGKTGQGRYECTDKDACLFIGLAMSAMIEGYQDSTIYINITTQII
jgi:hypothetical protein